MDAQHEGGLRHEECLSLEDILKLIYYLGLSSYGQWEDMMKKIQPDIISIDNVNVFSLYIQLRDITKKIKFALETTIVNSQKDLMLLNNYLFDIDEIYNYLNTNIVHFKEKNILRTTFSIINSIIKNKMMYRFEDEEEEEEDPMNIDIVNNDDDDDDGDVDFKRLFKSVKRYTSKNEKTDELYDQYISFKKDDSTKTLTTPGEKGRYLIKIDITDVNDLKGINKKDRWTKAAYRSQFLLQSKDSTYMQLHKIVLSKSRELAKIKNIKKQTYKN